MPNINLTLEDNHDGTVKVVCTPHASELLRRFKEGHEMSKAEAMAAMFLLKLMSDSMRSNYEDRKLVLSPDYTA